MPPEAELERLRGKRDSREQHLRALSKKRRDMQKGAKKKPLRPPQSQSKPGQESKMKPVPVSDTGRPASGKLQGKVALITGGDSGIGRAVAVLFAKEGARVAIAYLSEDRDAEETQRMIRDVDGECLLIPGDLSREINCKRAVARTIKQFGVVDILVNNAAVHFESKKLEDITTEQLQKTFSTNFFSYFWMTREALPHIPEGGVHHQHRIGHCLSRKSRTHRLCFDQGSHRELHAEPFIQSGEAENPRQRCSARAGVDTTYCLDVQT